MRILMVTEDIPAPQVGGLGKHVVTLANALINAGHHVDLMGRNDRDYATCAAEIGFNGRFIPGFNLSRAGWKEVLLGVFISPKRPTLARRIARAIIRYAASYDVIHYHGHLPLVGRYIPATINFVQTRHDQGSECLTHVRFINGEVCSTTRPQDCAGCIHVSPGPLRRLISAAAVERYRSETAAAFARHKTIFVSDFLRRQFLRAVPSADLGRTCVIHNFIDLARLRHQTSTAAPILPGSILFVGRIDQGKGLGAFLTKAAGRVPKGLLLNIIGDGPERIALEQRYANDQIIFHGWRPYNEVIGATAHAHVCVVPSILQESCGTTILEALALGRPCIALARGGTPELVRYQRYPGQLVLANNMSELVTKAFECARQKVEILPVPEQFDLDVSVVLRSILEIYSRS